MNAFVVRARKSFCDIVTAMVDEYHRRIPGKTIAMFFYTMIGASFLCWAMMNVPVTAITLYWGLFVGTATAYIMVQEARSDLVTNLFSKVCLYTMATLFLVMAMFTIGFMNTPKL